MLAMPEPYSALTSDALASAESSCTTSPANSAMNSPHLTPTANVTPASSINAVDENPIIQFTKGSLAMPDGTLKVADLWVDPTTGRILNPQQTFYASRGRPTHVIDLQGHILSPGLIDIQLNGAFGVDFSEFNGDEAAYEAGLRTVAGKLVETGVTSFLPTIISHETTLYPQVLPLLRQRSFPKSANILGWHAEGPFISPSKHGCHSPNVLVSAPKSFQSVDEILGAVVTSTADNVGVKLLTLAPEVDGMLESIPELVKHGVTVSLGHSTSTSAIAVAAVLSGATLITHLFNAMPQLHHREPGIIGLLGITPVLDATDIVKLRQATMARFRPQDEQLQRLLAQNELPFLRPYYGIIADGIHCHPSALSMAYSSHPGGCVLVTDAMSMLDPDQPDGQYEWDGRKVDKSGQRLTLQGTDTLAGSVVTMPTCVRNLVKFASISLAQALVCATSNAAKSLGPEVAARKGHLSAGADADLVVLDKDSSEVLATWVAGIEVWRADRGL